VWYSFFSAGGSAEFSIRQNQSQSDLENLRFSNLNASAYSRGFRLLSNFRKSGEDFRKSESLDSEK